MSRDVSLSPEPAHARIGEACFDLRSCSIESQWPLPAVLQNITLGRSKRRIIIGAFDAPSMQPYVQAVRKRNVFADMTDEGYWLSVTADRIVIAAHTPRGASYAGYTLAQLTQGSRVRKADILDWPRFPLRGAHLYVPPLREVDYFERLIAYLAQAKMNTIVLEIGAAIQSHRHPKINTAWQKATAYVRDYPWGQNDFQNANTLHARGKNSFHGDNGGWGDVLPHDVIRRILRCAREHHIEVIPEVQSLSHSYWLCMAYPEIAERQDDPWPCTYCPSNERTYELLFDVMDEWIDLFEPRTVHIGHDEWYFHNLCPKCSKRKASDLFADDVNRIHAHLAKRGIGCIMWADQLINSAELKRKTVNEWSTGKPRTYGGTRRVFEDETGQYISQPCYTAIKKIHPDVVLADWYHLLSSDTVDWFSKQGRRVLIGNLNPFRLDKEPAPLNTSRCEGGFISTWIEASPLSLAHDNWPLQALITADMLWSHRTQKFATRIDDYFVHAAKNRPLLQPPHAQPVTEKRKALSLLDQPICITPDAPVTIKLGQRCRAIRMVAALDGTAAVAKLSALYTFSRFDEYYRAAEVLNLKLIVKRAMDFTAAGNLPIRLGMETGTASNSIGLSADTRPTYANPVRLPDGRWGWEYEWTHVDPDHQLIDSIELTAGVGLTEGSMLVTQFQAII